MNDHEEIGKALEQALCNCDRVTITRHKKGGYTAVARVRVERNGGMYQRLIAIEWGPQLETALDGLALGVARAYNGREWNWLPEFTA